MRQAANGLTDGYDALADIFESIEHFLIRLDIYTKIPPTPALDEIVVKIIVELVSTLALATKDVNQGQPSGFIPPEVVAYSVQCREIRQKASRRR